MSVWTHVCGCIRLDSMAFRRKRHEGIKIVDECLGKTFEFDDTREDRIECGVPFGSEESVQYSSSITGGDNSVCWGLIDIWGDLRDYDDANAIFRWIKESCAKLQDKGFGIRSCAVLVDIEYRNRYLIVDNRESENENDDIIMIEIIEVQERKNLTSINENETRNIELD